MPEMRFVYRHTPQAELALHMHYPADWRAEDRRPVTLFFHGGSYNSGNAEQFVPHADYLAGRGMVTARAEFRIHGRHGVGTDESVRDGRSAVRWLRAHAARLGIDPQRLVACGGSTGGHMAACAALLEGVDHGDDDLSIPCRPDALVLMNPVLRIERGVRSWQWTSPELAAAMSPLPRLNRSCPPTWMTYGSLDPFIAHGQAFMERATELGLRAELFLATRQTHAFFNHSPWLERTIRQVDLFLASLGLLQGPPTIEVP